jgi:hypothetical protein
MPSAAPCVMRLGDEVSVSRFTLKEGGWNENGVVVLRNCVYVAAIFDAFTQDHRLGVPILIERSDLDYPLAVYEPTEQGQTRVALAVRDGALYSQTVFQFAHEYCHVMANMGRDNPCLWFEEAICEVASLFALRAVSVLWAECPAIEGAESYSEYFAAYAQSRVDEALLHAPAGQEFATWLDTQLPAMALDPYIRMNNRVVALRLQPLFERAPAAWAAVRYLNRWDVPPLDMPQFFQQWRAAAPVALHHHIESVKAILFGCMAADVPEEART